jgi:hypothetical protein
VLAVLKYDKHGLTNDVFNHIRHVYDEITFSSQVGTRWSMEYEDYDEGEAHILGVHKQVSDEIRHMRWREHIHPNHLQEIHLPNDGQQCLWKLGCGDLLTHLFYSFRCRIRIELYHFLHMFHNIIKIMDDIDM